MKKLERLKTIVGILLAIGIIFGTFMQWSAGVPFGWAWFVNTLWFALGFPVLVGVGWILFTLLIVGEAEIKAKLEKE